VEFVLALVGGLTLGSIHAFDMDHVAAVTAFTSKHPDSRKAMWFGIVWGLGHTATLVLFGGLSAALKFVIPPIVESIAEAAVGVFLVGIGIWVLLGFCIVLLLTGMTKVDPALYESARIDGASWFKEFSAITVPLLRYEIGVCLTVTVIAALAAFDIIWVSTAGGPGNATSVPGIQIYVLAFTQRAVGLASALAVMLMFLVVAVIIPIQWLSRERAL